MQNYFFLNSLAPLGIENYPHYSFLDNVATTSDPQKAALPYQNTHDTINSYLATLAQKKNHQLEQISSLDAVNTDNTSTESTKNNAGSKRFTCNLCSSSFLNSGNLYSHWMTHTGEKPYACDFCDYKSNVRGNLKIHVRKHTGEKPYQCSLCDYKSRYYTSFKTHVVKTHSEQLD